MGTVQICLGLFLLFIGVHYTFGISDSSTMVPQSQKCDETPRTNTGKLKKALFCGYDSTVRPVPHHSNQTVLKMAIFPTNINWIMMDRKGAYLGVWIRLEWRDNLLAWNTSDYDGLQEFYSDPGKIWVPDIIISDPPQQNGVTRQMSCTVNYQGYVECITTTSVLVNCNIDMTYYPFDRHYCSVVFQPRFYKGSEIDIDFIKDDKSDHFKYYRSHGVWDFVSPKFNRSVTLLKNDMHVYNMEYTFLIARKYTTFKLMYTSPAIVTIMMVLSMFWLDVQSSARVILAGLAVITQVSIIRWLMEVMNSNLENPPKLILFFRNSLMLTGIALVWTVAARSMCTAAFFPHSFHSITANFNNIPIFKFLLPQDIFLKSGASGDEDESSLVVHRDCVEQQWRVVTILIDRLLFCLFSLLFFYFFVLLP